MSIPLILILITTAAGLLTLWKDDFMKEKQIISREETIEEKQIRLENNLKATKVLKIKIISSTFIIMTLGFTIAKIYSDQNRAQKSEWDHIIHRQTDSLRYARDSMEHATIDIIKDVQIKAYESIEHSINKIDSSTKYSVKSFNNLTIQSKRQYYLLDSNIHIKFLFEVNSPRANSIIDQFLQVYPYYRKEGFFGIDESCPFVYEELQQFLNKMHFEIYFYSRNDKDLIEVITQKDTLADIKLGQPKLVLTNKQSLIFESNNDNLTYDPPSPINRFKVDYQIWSHMFDIACLDMPMKIMSIDPGFNSISDYADCPIAIKIVSTGIINKECLFNLDNSRLYVKINFCGKAIAESNDLHNVENNRAFSSFYLDTLKFTMP